MAKKRKSKVPVLRTGLTVDQLLADTWMVSETRYVTDGEVSELTDSLLRAACQGLIDHADSGNRVTRKTVINTLCSLADMLRSAKDRITGKMSKGEFTPTLLDKVANA
jgi:hypothetical protein